MVIGRLRSILGLFSSFGYMLGGRMAGVGLVIIDPRSSKSTFGANSMSFGRVGGGYWVPFGPCLRVLIHADGKTPQLPQRIEC